MTGGKSTNIILDAVVKRASYDTSHRKIEIVSKEYWFLTKGRISHNKPKWKHYKYYNSIQAAETAIENTRRMKFATHHDNETFIIRWRFAINIKS